MEVLPRESCHTHRLGRDLSFGRLLKASQRSSSTGSSIGRSSDGYPTAARGCEAPGRLIASETFGLLSSNLQSALATGGVTNALPYCSLAASPLTASVGERYGVTLRRVTQRARNPKDKANSTEAEILDQYRIELSRSNALIPIVTNLQDSSLTFFAPIVLTNALCLKCHGEPGRDIAPITWKSSTDFTPKTKRWDSIWVNCGAPVIFHRLR